MDITRSSHDGRKHYDATRALQGRPVTDDDLNVADIIAKEERRAAHVDVIGPAGSPDDGFSIAVDASQAAIGELDFEIRPGTFYVGGLRLTMEDQAGHGERFAAQRDWLQQRAGDRSGPDVPTRQDLVYIEAWQQPVSAVEDGELLEAALGGVDTSGRVRTMRRVRLMPDVAATDCAAAWKKFTDAHPLEGDGSLDTDAVLVVGFSRDSGGGDLCSPRVTGGYLGAENQAIRVEIVEPGKLVWGFDNGAPLYRAELNGLIVKLLTPPRDEFHRPAAGQTVEVLGWSAYLANGEKVAEARGPFGPALGSPPSSYFARVQDGYDPDTGEFTVDTAPPDPGFNAGWVGRYTDDIDKSKAAGGEASGPDRYVFVRVWNQGSNTTAMPVSYAGLADPLPLGSSGVLATIAGVGVQPGDSWVVAARPETPREAVPWQLSEGRPPDGPRRFYAPLALVSWVDGKLDHVEDCRPTFVPLTSAWAGGGCAITVAPRPGWDKVFARFQPGQDVNLCFQPGTYRLDRAVLVKGLGSVKLTGAGEGSRIAAPNLEAAFRFQQCDSVVVRDMQMSTGVAAAGKGGSEQRLNGTLTFERCRRVEVEGVRLSCAASNARAAACIAVRPFAADPAQRTPSSIVRIRGCELSPGHAQVGIVVIDADQAHLEDNVVRVADDSLPPLRVLVQDKVFRAALRRTLLSRMTFATKGTALKTTNIRLPTGIPANSDLKMEVQILSAPVVNTAAWTSALGDALKKNSEAEIRAAIYAFADKVVMGDPPPQIPAFGTWLRQVTEALVPTAAQGIVVAGTVARDVRVLHNRLVGVQQGIHIGLSHADPVRTSRDQAETVLVAGNRVDLRLSAGASGERHGIFVGNCQSLIVEDNRVRRVDSTTGSNLPLDGIRVIGLLGPLAVIERNHIEGCTVGIRVEPNPSSASNALWRVLNNVAPGAKTVVQTRGNVIFTPNQLPTTPWNMP